MHRTCLQAAAFVAACCLLAPALPASAQAGPPAQETCFGRAPTIIGGGQITGTPGSDVILGSAGDDVIDGGGGDDRICGSAGDDKIQGGTGHDRCDGGTGQDTAGGCEDSTSIP